MPRIAIIGATAAGLYASDLLMRCAHQIPGISMQNPLLIDVFDAAAAPTSISMTAHATAQASATPGASAQSASSKRVSPAAKLRLLGNVRISTSQHAGDISSAELHSLYDVVLWAGNPAHAPEGTLSIADVRADIAVHYAVGEIRTQLAASTARVSIEPTEVLDARGIVFTVWDNPLKLPTDWNLQRWQHEIDLSHGAPICF